MKNKLKFSNSGKEVQIIFESGAESFYYDSKEEALKAIKNCHDRKKISKKEFKEFVEEIASSELPSFLEGLAALSTAVIGTFIDSLLEDLEFEVKKLPLQDVSFDICDCGKNPKHGYFIDDGDKLSMKIFSKSEAYIFIDKLEELEIVTGGDASSLRVCLDMTEGLLENPLMN